MYSTNLNVQKPNQYKKWLFGLHFLSHQSGRKFNRNRYLDFPHSSIRIIQRSGGIKKSRDTPMVNTDMLIAYLVSCSGSDFCVICGHGNFCQSRELRYLGSYLLWSHYLPKFWVGMGPCCFRNHSSEYPFLSLVNLSLSHYILVFLSPPHSM